MRIKTEIDGREFYSIDKPKMKHLRVGGRLLSVQEKIADEPKKMYDYIEEIYGYIKDTFPKVTDGDIDNLSTEKFMELVAEIAKWANGSKENDKKKE